MARNILQVAQELRDLVTTAPYLADRAPYAAGRVLAAAERLDSLAASAGASSGVIPPGVTPSAPMGSAD